MNEYTTTGRWPETQPHSLRFRTTDLYVHERTKSWPLSVTTSWIAFIAMRCAELLTELAADRPVDRAGGGLVAETYPAAVLRCWEIPRNVFKNYKNPAHEYDPVRRRLLEHIDTTVIPGQLLLDHQTRTALEHSDHLIDALVCAILARQLELKLTESIPEHLAKAAAAEGWIHLPNELIAPV